MIALLISIIIVILVLLVLTIIGAGVVINGNKYFQHENQRLRDQLSRSEAKISRATNLLKVVYGKKKDYSSPAQMDNVSDLESTEERDAIREAATKEESGEDQRSAPGVDD